MDKIEMVQLSKLKVHNNLMCHQKLGELLGVLNSTLNDLRKEYGRAVDLEQKQRIAKLIARFSLDVRRTIRFRHELIEKHVNQNIKIFGDR